VATIFDFVLVFTFLEMLEFMDFVQHAFYKASNWNVENSYSNLTATARGLYLQSYSHSSR
jgi:Mitochondrial distribution and morphology protein 10